MLNSILCAALAVQVAPSTATPLVLPPNAEEARKWFLSLPGASKAVQTHTSAQVDIAEAIVKTLGAHSNSTTRLSTTVTKVSVSALECVPIPNTPIPMEICVNATDTCVCFLNATNQTACQCASANCLGLGDLASVFPNAVAVGQTAEQEDASGIKITIQRFLSATIIRPKRVVLGDPSGCGDIDDSHWCLWLTGGGQPILGGACVPRSCTADEQQAQVRSLALLTYVVKLLLTPPTSKDFNDTYAAMHALNTTYAVHCTSTEQGPGWWERTGGTRQKQFSGDKGAQLSVAIICILVGGGILSSVILKVRSYCGAEVEGELEPLIAAVESRGNKAAMSAPVVPATTTPPIDGGEASGEYHEVAQHLAGERTQATQIFGEKDLVPNSSEFASESTPELNTAAAIRAEISQGLRTSNTGGWASPTVSPAPSPHASMPHPTGSEHKSCNLAWLWSLLECFDADAHWNALLKCSAQRPTSFLHGFRTWSMAWVIFGHTGFDPTIPGFDNPVEIVRKYQSNFRFVIAYGFTAVDTFFFMSGFLSTYLLVSRWPKRLTNPLKVIFRLFLVYLDRYARLTPLYALMILFSRYLVQYIAQGPVNVLADEGAILGPCGADWWKNLLYINTVGNDPSPVCLGHTWYLGNDMIFVWVFTPFMVLFTYGRVGALVAAGLVTISLGIFLGVATHYGGHQDDFSILYFRPWTRAPPYLWGMLAAFILRCNLITDWLKTVLGSPIIRFILYIIAAAHLFGVLVWQWMKYTTVPLFLGAVPMAIIPKVLENTREDYGKSWNFGETFFYFYGWGCGLLILTVVWGLGHGGCVTRFLGHPIFECLGRLTYGAYLTHPIVLVVMKLSTTAGALPHFNDFWLLSNWTAATVGAFILAAVFFVFVERPAGALWELATQQKKRK